MVADPVVVQKLCQLTDRIADYRRTGHLPQTLAQHLLPQRGPGGTLSTLSPGTSIHASNSSTACATSAAQRALPGLPHTITIRLAKLLQVDNILAHHSGVSN